MEPIEQSEKDEFKKGLDEFNETERNSVIAMYNDFMGLLFFMYENLMEASTGAVCLTDVQLHQYYLHLCNRKYTARLEMFVSCFCGLEWLQLGDDEFVDKVATQLPNLRGYLGQRPRVWRPRDILKRMQDDPACRFKLNAEAMVRFENSEKMLQQKP